MNPQVIVVDGYDGTIDEDTSTAPVIARVRADLDRQFPDGWHGRYEANDPEVRSLSRDLFQYHLFMPYMVHHHNQAVPLAQRYADLAQLTSRAVAETDAMYADLDKNTTVNWLAAHHRFILAVVEARRLLTELVDAAIALRDSKLAKEINDRHSKLTAMYYEQHVPAEQHITIPDVDAAELALADFVETTRDRIDILRATVSGGYPAGFAPAPVSPAPAPAGPDDDEDWMVDAPASRATVARERAW